MQCLNTEFERIPYWIGLMHFHALKQANIQHSGILKLQSRQKVSDGYKKFTFKQWRSASPSTTAVFNIHRNAYITGVSQD